MSFSPSLSVVRLQELKLWQGSYENLIQKSKQNSQPSESEHLDGISTLDSSTSSDIPLEVNSRNSKNWDKKTILPIKPFEQLLEEKLAEDAPLEHNSKPKRPFLKKGQGLARFRMGPGHPTTNKTKDFTSKKPLGNQKGIPRQKTSPLARKGILKKTNPFFHQYIDLSPLTVPDFVKPRGTWKSVFENYEKKYSQENDTSSEGSQEEIENYEEFRQSLGYGEFRDRNTATEMDRKEIKKTEQLLKISSSKQMVDVEKSDDFENALSETKSGNFGMDNIMEKISEYSHKYLHPTMTCVSNSIPESIPEISTPKFTSGVEDLSIYEKKLQRELQAFELLEKKVENSSFCSTNTSVANLLASTPQKEAIKNDEINEFFDAKDSTCSLDVFDSVEFTNDRQERIELELHEIVEKTDVLQQFLMKLRKMEDKSVREENFTLDSDATKKSEKSTSTSMSFSEEHTRWSTRSPSLTDDYTEFETTCQEKKCEKVDAGVNTSFDGFGDETVKNWEPCQKCEEIRLKFSETKRKHSEVKMENSTLKKNFKDLENDFEEMKKEMRKSKNSYKEHLDNLQDALDKEKKKLAKEKSYFESYVKDFQNRPTKKEREEITRLKQELADVKELLKLKDSKSGATQARLRTQIKQHEKEISELKNTVERLQKENAKLSASQKYTRRPQEVKMLHEINKNLSKLTEETLKKQINKSGINDVDEAEKEASRECKVSKNCDGNKENATYEKNVCTKEVQKKVIKSNESSRNDSAKLDMTSLEISSIEKQYERIFGKVSSPRNSNVSANLEKTEKTLPDGSMEISYSNGNHKTISADGQVIVIKYFNGDVKETNLKEKIIRYHYASSDSWHTQYSDGTEVMEYKDGQTCKKYIDGKTEVTYPDGSLRIINPDGTEEHRFPDGRKTLKTLQGEQIILLPNGQREVHTQEYKRREYPDGTIRTLHKDGSVETVYSNGRVRIKDNNGVLVMDTHQESVKS